MAQVTFGITMNKELKKQFDGGVRNEGISFSVTDFSGTGCLAFHAFHMLYRRLPQAKDYAL
ncbi:MAG: hypothetical protein II922_05105 [Succinimonas sp.]|nr:hypothetical protein [Succinimonas sp.]